MDLSAIAAISDPKLRLAEYSNFLEGSIERAESARLQSLIDHLLSDEVPLVVSRDLVLRLVTSLSRLPPDLDKTTSLYALEKIQPRAVSFEEPVSLLREHLADLYCASADWSRAAAVLAGIDLDTGMRLIDASYKLRLNIRIAMLYLEDDDAGNAETYIKRASFLISSNQDKGLELQYKSCYARILDSKRRFLEAATRYYELAQTPLNVVSADGQPLMGGEDRLLALSKAVTCAILAAAGPHRSRILATLYKNEQCASLPTFSVLEKVYMDRILRPLEVESFAKTLAEHQLAITPDGSTVLDLAVLEHNLLAASRLYQSIRTDQLGALLGVTPERAERIAAGMMGEGRVRGYLDQETSLIYFLEERRRDVGSSGAAGGGGGGAAGAARGMAEGGSGTSGGTSSSASMSSASKSASAANVLSGVSGAQAAVLRMEGGAVRQRDERIGRLCDALNDCTDLMAQRGIFI